MCIVVTDFITWGGEGGSKGGGGHVHVIIPVSSCLSTCCTVRKMYWRKRHFRVYAGSFVFPVINEKELSNESSVTGACRRGTAFIRTLTAGPARPSSASFFLAWSSPGWAARQGLGRELHIPSLRCFLPFSPLWTVCCVSLQHIAYDGGTLPAGLSDPPESESRHVAC